MPILKKHAQLARAGGDVQSLYQRGKKAIGDLRVTKQQYGTVREELVNATYLTEDERTEALAELDAIASELVTEVKTFANDEL